MRTGFALIDRPSPLGHEFIQDQTQMLARLSPLLKETFSWRDPLDRAQENKVCGDWTQPKACRKKSHEVKRMRHHWC